MGRKASGLWTLTRELPPASSSVRSIQTRDKLAATLPTVTADRQRTRPLGTRFYVLWFGQAISQIGDYIAYFTVPAFVSVLTNRATDFAVVFAAENVPTLLFGFTLGVFLDRFPFRVTAIVTDIGRVAAFALLAGLAAAEAPDIWLLFVISFAIGSFAAGFNAALPSFLPAIVDSDHIATANARLSMTQQVSFVAAPALGGAIVALWGFTVAFLINAATFLVSAFSLAALRADRPLDDAPERRGFRHELREGLAFLWREPMLRYATLAAAAANLVIAFIESMLVLIGREIFGIDDFGQLGAVFGALGVGGILGAVAAPYAIRRLGLGRAIIGGLCLLAFGLLLVAVQATTVGVAIALAIALAGVPIVNIAIVTVRQTKTPEALLGRVTSASRSIAWGALPVGALISGILADKVIGLEAMLYVTPAVLAGVALALTRTPLWARDEDVGS